MRPAFEVADVLQQLGDGIETIGLNTHQLRTLSAIKVCRTPALGGHVDVCDQCGVTRISYNSCRNRHCPKCQGHRREQWIQQRTHELLPCTYYHVVFTLPHQLHPLALHRPKLVYDALFKAAWQTIDQFGGNTGVQLGMIALLHTWGQQLSLHPHLHCIVPGGGVDAQGNWRKKTRSNKYLFAVKALSKVFRAKYVAQLRAAGINDKTLLDSLFEKDWVVYAKRPFGGPPQVIEYIGRYTHKVAISNHRIKSVQDGSVTFVYKDYANGDTQKLMTLSHAEFARRFALHILPLRFVRIRHYGILSSTWKRMKLTALRKHLHLSCERSQIKTQLKTCPCCKTGTLITLLTFGRRGPPREYLPAVPPTSC